MPLIVKQTLGVVALFGLAASVTIHLLTYGGYAPSETVPGILLLHFGVFVVWFPTVLTLRDAQRREKSLVPFFKSIPRWVRAIAIVCGTLIYASGFAAMLADEGVAVERDGRYLMVDHGEVLKELSEEEFHGHQVREDRFTSSIWAMFYGIAMIVLLYDRGDDRAQRSSAGSS